MGENPNAGIPVCLKNRLSVPAGKMAGVIFIPNAVQVSSNVRHHMDSSRFVEE